MGAPNVLRTAAPLAEHVQSQLDASREVTADLKRQMELMKKLEIFLKGFRRALQGEP